MLQRYHDGDLSEIERAQVESGLAAHPGSQVDLDEIQLIGDVLRESSAEVAEEYDPARVWAGLQSQLDAPAAASAPAAAAQDPPGLLDSLLKWLTPPRLVPIGAFAAAAVAWMVISTPPPIPDAPAPGATPSTDLAKPAKPRPPRTAIAQAPTAPSTSDHAADDASDDRGGVIVDSVEAEDADVVIGKTAGDEQAMVIWLFADADTALETD